jgi:hypothetical protein
MTKVTLNDREVTLERFTLQKAMRVITMLGLIQKAVPDATKMVGGYRREYAEANAVELDRVQAKMRFGRQPILDADDQPIFHEGELLTLPSPLDRFTEQDWEKAGNVLRMRPQPSGNEVMIAVFPEVFELAEPLVLRLLGIMVMSNADVARYVKAGDVWEHVDELVESTIAPAMLEEIMELAVTVGELIDGQVLAKAKALGARLGNLKRLFGFETTTTPAPPTSPTSSEQPEQPSSDSSSPSEPDSPGPTPTESSDSTGTSSPPSATSSPDSATTP